MLARILKVLPASRRVFLIVWPFLAIVLLLVILAAESLAILSAGRAYVEGESLWSKAQKESAMYLLRYAHTRAEQDYFRFVEALKVPLGDRKARIELEKPDPDYAIAYQGFLEGRNHPDDIPGMIELFRRFRHISYIDRAVRLWEDGDGAIAAFQAVGEELHQHISSGRATNASIHAFLDRIYAIDADLTPKADAFSASLGEATRWTKQILLISTIALAVTLVPIGIWLSRRMLKHSEAFEDALRRSEERFQLAVTGSNDGIWDWNIATDEIYYSPRCKELVGCGVDEIDDTREEFDARLHPDDREPTAAAVKAHLAGRGPYDVEFRLKCKSGEYRWFRARGQSVRNAVGRAVRMAGSLSDITDRKTAEAQLYAEKERAQVTLASIGDAVITTDTNGLVEYLNPVAEALTAWHLRDAEGLPLEGLLQIVDEKTHQPTADAIERVLREGRPVKIAANTLLVRRDGEEIAIDHSAAPIRDRSGQITGVVLVFRDVSRERQYAAKLSYQASHDALTGLINRREFEHRLRRALSSAAEFQRHHAVMYLDLDQFKVVNDTCGHPAGDELMRQISAVLQRRLREGDTLARLGGDEFGVLLENCPAEHAARIAEELRQTVADFPFAWHSRTFTLSVSIGVVNVANGLFTLAEVLSAADAACYMAKEKGRNRVQVYHPEDSELSLRQGEMEWVGRIHKALEDGAPVPVRAGDRPHRRNGGRRQARRVAHPHARRARRAGPPDGFHPRRRALQPHARDRPLGDPDCIRHARRYGGRRRARDRHVLDQPVRRVAGRRALAGVRARAVRHLRHLARHDLLRDHRDRGDRQSVEGGALHQRAQGARLPLLARRLRRRHVLLRLSQAPAGRLPEDRRRLREGHARRSHRPRDGRGDQPHRPRDGQEHHRRVRRERAAYWLPCATSGSTSRKGTEWPSPSRSASSSPSCACEVTCPQMRALGKQRALVLNKRRLARDCPRAPCRVLSCTTRAGRRKIAGFARSVALPGAYNTKLTLRRVDDAPIFLR